MAEQGKNTDNGKLTRAQRQLNCQINYFVMRRIWNILHKRGKESLYDALGIKKVRYTRQVDSGSIRLTKDELKQMVDQTGVSEGIFKGEYCFAITGETENDWEDLFQKRDKKRELKQYFLE